MHIHVENLHRIEYGMHEICEKRQRTNREEEKKITDDVNQRTNGKRSTTRHIAPAKKVIYIFAFLSHFIAPPATYSHDILSTLLLRESQLLFMLDKCVTSKVSFQPEKREIECEWE